MFLTCLLNSRPPAFERNLLGIPFHCFAAKYLKEFNPWFVEFTFGSDSVLLPLNRTSGHPVATCCDMFGVENRTSAHVRSQNCCKNQVNLFRPTMSRYVALKCCDRLAWTWRATCQHPSQLLIFFPAKMFLAILPPLPPTGGVRGGICKNISLHLARKYARVFARGQYLFQEANTFALRHVQGLISQHIFKVKFTEVEVASGGYSNASHWHWGE